MGIALLALPGKTLASFTDTAIDWTLFAPPTGYTIPYTFNGQPVSDEESSSDTTNGGAAVSPSLIDLASGSPDGTNPGPYDTPSFGYYNGGDAYDPSDPATYQNDVVRFTMRLVADPSKGDGFNNYHWNVLLDVDGDGYKEFWIDLFGKYSANGYDQLQILYDNSNAQTLPDTPDKMPELRVDEFRAYHDENASTFSHTRVRTADDGSGDYFIDIQVPLTAFTDTLGNQVLYPDSPVGFVFSTSASATDPLQKDYMTDLDFLTENDPISFGDIVNPNGDAILYFADSDLNERDYYTAGDPWGDSVVLYLRDAFANTDENVVNTTTATVTDPFTGDTETVTLTESGPNTGIFTNLGGASQPVSSDESNAWIPYVTTSEVTTTENWTLTYSDTTGQWTVVGSVSGPQTQPVTAGTEYVSDDGQIRFTLYEVNPVDGATITFTSYQGDPLPTSSTGGTADDDGTLQTTGGETITYSYTQTKTAGETKTLTDTALIIGAGDPYIEFTRADGSPTADFQLTTDPGTSDELYVTVYHSDSNTDPGTAESITATLTGDANNPTETQTLTLVETGPDTGIFRNAAGLSTQVSDGTVTANDNLWEDIDQGEVTATFNYSGTDYDTTASLFYINDAGRVNFTNGAGTLGVEEYAAGDPLFIQVSDESVTCGGTLTVTVTTTSGDTETVVLYETATGSGVYMNRVNDLVTTNGSATISSASATFQTDGLVGGDEFIIATGPDTGTYTIASVDSEIQLTLDTAFTADRIDLGYMYPSLSAGTYDGTVASSDGVLEASHNDAVTVSYHDCTDGDVNPGNDIKTDVAIYNAPPIVINEVLFHPDLITDVGATDQNQFEYIQLYNASAVTQTLTGYTVNDGDGFSYTVPKFDTDLNIDLELLPGQKLYIVLIPDSGVPPIPPGYDSTNNAYYVYAPVEALPEVYGETLVTADGSPNVTDASATYITDGVSAGDAFIITSGPDAGNYLVDSVISETELVLTQALTSDEPGIGYYAQYPPGTAPVDQLSDPDNGINLATTAGSQTVTSSSATFVNDGVQPGDVFVIANGADAGSYVVETVVSDTELTLTQALTATDSDLHYTVGASEDQISLYDGGGSIVDYVAWSTTATTETDFKGDDNDAITAGIWTDNSFKNVDSTDVNGIDGLIEPGSSIYRAATGKDTDQPEDWVYSAPSINTAFVLTLALVEEVRRYPDSDTPVVEWTTSSEVGTLGYHLYRRDEDETGWTRVNPALLPATPPSHFGAVHRYRDPGARLDRNQWYLLEEIDVRGRRHTYGPYPVRPDMAATGPQMIQDYTRKPNAPAVQPAPLTMGRMTLRSLAVAPAITAGTALRLTVPAAGLYFVSSDTIAEGLEPVIDPAAAADAIAAGQLNLRHGQQSVAYLPAPEDGGLYFYARAADSRYTSQNVYWLETSPGERMSAGGVRRSSAPATTADINGNSRLDMVDTLFVLQQAAGLRSGNRPGQGPEPANGGQYFSARGITEENHADGVDTLNDPEQDLWYWGYFLNAPGSPLFPQAFTVNAPAPALSAGTKAFVELEVLAATPTTNTVDVVFNDSPIASLNWAGESGRPHTLQTWVDAALLNSNGVNTLSLAAHADPNAPGTAWFLNRVRISYPSEFVAVNDTLIFSGGGNDVVTVSGFSSDTVKVFDITKPAAPVEIIDTTIDLVGTVRVSFRAAGPEARYLATVADTTRTPTAAGTTPEALTSGPHGADYVLIVPPALSTAAQELADYRADQGLSVEMVSLDAIMDGFNAGLPHPDAIREFLLHAQNNWNPAPQYVVLVGKGTYDYTNTLQLGTNLVPPRLIATADGLFASDNWLADLTGDDGVPEMAIGRLPVADAAELTALIQKIKGYESAAAGEWNRRILMVADSADQLADFAVNSSRVAEHIPATPYQVEDIHVGVNATPEQARAAVADGFNTGSLLVNYIGHGGHDRIGNSGIFLDSDVAGLSANASLPVLTALTCIVNRFEIPTAGYRALGEQLLLSSGGAIAVWAPTGLSANADAEALNITFMDAFLGSPGGRLGDAVLAALAVLGQQSPQIALPAVYTLLGDPALRLPVP